MISSRQERARRSSVSAGPFADVAKRATVRDDCGRQARADGLLRGQAESRCSIRCIGTVCEMSELFNQSQIEAIADALGDTPEGLTGTEIAYLLQIAKIPDVTPTLTKRFRLFNSFAQSQNSNKDRGNIIAFITSTMQPARFSRDPERFEVIRSNLNRALAFSGLAVDANGELLRVEKAQTLPEAQKRAQELRSQLVARNVHPDVLAFCREELIADNYFHAVLEATKSVADKLRRRTGAIEDGAALIDIVFGGERPLLAINPLSTESEKSEQRGFANLLKGVFGMFRNRTAHEARLNWAMKKADAEDLLSVVSLIHRRIDSARGPQR